MSRLFTWKPKGADHLNLPKKKPNIVYITSDELKASAVSVYGNTEAYTPNMAKLSEQGVLFNQAFTTFPKCVPARSALLTGRYPHTGGHRTLPGFELRQGEPNLVELLKQAGYTTAMYGKNHWVEPEQQARLFDEYANDSPGKTTRNHRLDGQDEEQLYRGMYRFEELDGEELRDRYETDRACMFIKERSGGDKPYFLLMDISMPHPVYVNIQPYIAEVRRLGITLPTIEAIESAPALLQAYRKVYDLEQLSEAGWRQIVEAYYSMVSYADHCLGRVMKALDDAGATQDTMVIFTADHGDFAGEHGCVEKWDTMFYECLIKVPLMIRYPGILSSGLRSDALTDNVDIVPTILDLAGMPVPAWVHGESLAPIMHAEVLQHKRHVFCEGGVENAALEHALHHENAFYTSNLPNYKYKQQVMVEYPWTMQRAKMIRSEKWKLVFRVSGDKELYDLENDPNEWVNVADRVELSGIVNELMEELLKWTIKTETDLPLVTDMRA